MAGEITTVNIKDQQLLPDFGPSIITTKSPSFNMNKPSSECGYESFAVSMNIEFTSCIKNETVTNIGSISRIISPKQAYGLALDTLKNFEDKWDLFAQKEAKRLFVFDEEKD